MSFSFLFLSAGPGTNNASLERRPKEAGCRASRPNDSVKLAREQGWCSGACPGAPEHRTAASPGAGGSCARPAQGRGRRRAGDSSTAPAESHTDSTGGRGEARPPDTLRSDRGSCTAPQPAAPGGTGPSWPDHGGASSGKEGGSATLGSHAHPRDRSPCPARSNPQFWLSSESRPPQRRPGPGTSESPQGWGGSHALHIEAGSKCRRGSGRSRHTMLSPRPRREPNLSPSHRGTPPGSQTALPFLPASRRRDAPRSPFM